jgi:hypothetical protein
VGSIDIKMREHYPQFFYFFHGFTYAEIPERGPESSAFLEKVLPVCMTRLQVEPLRYALYTWGRAAVEEGSQKAGQLLAA